MLPQIPIAISPALNDALADMEFLIGERGLTRVDREVEAEETKRIDAS